MTRELWRGKKLSHEHSVPWFWPFAAAIEMEKQGLELFSDNLKFISGAEEITAPPQPQ